MRPSPRPWAVREDSSSSLSDVENRPPTSTVRLGRVPPIQTGMLSASYAFSHANSPRSHRKKLADEAKKPRRRRVQWKDEDEFEQLSPASSVGSPVSAKCPRILRAKSLRGANYSPTAKRWIALLILIAGLGLLRSFVVTRQVLHSAIADRYHQRGGTDWLVSLPQTIYATLSGGESVVEDIDWAPIALDEEWKRAGTMTQYRAQRRRKRTKPPSAYPSNPFGSVKSKQKLDSTPPPRLTLDLPSHRELKAEASPSSQSKHNSIRRRLEEGDEQEQSEQEQPLFCGQQVDEASQLNPQNFPPSAAIGPGSRVVVTGALSQIGMEFILQLHELCGAKVIIGIDSAYPNTRHERMDMVESRYEYLRRRVPGMQNLIVPTFGIYPDPNQNNMGGFDLMQRMKPTHIVHLAGMEEGRGEYTDFGETNSPFDGNRSLMRMLESILSMDQVLSSIAASNKDRPEGQQRPQLVYISSNEAGDRPGVMVDGGSVTAASVYGTTSLLKEMLASYYHRHHRVSSVGIRVPTVFGPFSRPGSLLYDMAERTVRHAAGKDVDSVPSYHLDRDRYELSNILSRREGALSEAKEQLVYVYDTASAILSALQFKKDYGSAGADSTGAAIVRIGSKYTTSMKDLNERMQGYLPPADQWEPNANSSLTPKEKSNAGAVINSPGLSISDTERDRDLLGWTHTTGIHEGTKAALAWQVLKAYPYGLPESVPGYSSFHSLLKDSRDSLPYHSLPCAAGCQWGGRMCSPSVWDEVMETTKKITASCQYVLYTVDLHPSLKGMAKQSEPSERPGWEEQFCKIAFISSSSKLARMTYAELEREVPLHEWNGSRKQGYWTIVVVPGSKDNLPEDQISLAKLSPTNLFGEGVERAMFMNHRRIVVTTDQAMNVMAQMEVEEMPEPEPYTVFDARLKHNVLKYHPSHPGRLSVFFTTRFSFPKGWSNDAGKLAQVVGASAKVPRTAGTQRQTDFYKETSSLVRTCHQRSPEYQRYFQDNHFNFDFVRTSWVVHDLTSEAGRTLRCEMYEEHSLWGNNGMEDMSIAYVLAKRKVKRQLGPTALEMDEMEQWHPLLVPREPDDEEAIRDGPVYFDYLESAQREMTDSEGETMHVSFFPQQAK